MERQNTAASPEQASQIRSEQIHALYRQLPLALFSSAVVPAIMVGVLWESPMREAMLRWLAVMGAVVVARTLLWRAYRRDAYEPGWAQRWGNYYLAGTFAGGCAWGAAGVMLFDPQVPEQLSLITLVLAGMGAGAVIAYSAWLPAFFAYFLPSTLPFIVISLVAGARVQVLMASTVLLFVVALSYYARSFRDTLVQSWRLRFENVHLIEELQEKKAEAEAANVAKSRFLAAASHDLRQPLHALTLFVSALDERRHAPETRAIVDNVNVSVQALEKMFNALLDISRLDAGVLHPNPVDFRLQDLFDRLVNEYAPVASLKGLELHCPESQAVIHSDSALLERILRNYLTNAIRYTERGSVTLRAVAGAGAVRIEVADTGIGIPPDQHREIFREFHQLHNPERDRAKGLGLGLAIVERLSRLLRYPIAVESAPGSGSVFSVVVPAGDPAAVEDGHDAATERVFTDLAGLRVLVIDDESGVRDGMRTLLAQWGCEVLLAADEDEAMTQLHRDGCAPDAIVADYRLRAGRTGVQAIGRVRGEWGETIPALIVTGETAADQLKEVETSGYSLLFKPVPAGPLRAFLRDAGRKQAPHQ